MSSERVQLILSLSRALWGEVTPNIRAVFIRMNNAEIRTRFVYYTQPSEDELESAGCVGTEVISDFGDATTISEVYEVNADRRVDPAEGEAMVYRRKD